MERIIVILAGFIIGVLANYYLDSRRKKSYKEGYKDAKDGKPSQY